MNIVNINSEIEVNDVQQSFVEEVLLCGYRHDRHDENSFYKLSKKVPIFLLNEESMKKYDAKEESDYEPNSETKPKTEWLGFYGRDSYGIFENTAKIVLCPKRIGLCVRTEEEFMFLLAKVIVHELAHAKMDSQNQNKQYNRQDIFYYWMEESSANRYTLEILQEFSDFKATNRIWRKKLFDFAVDFVKKQPSAYALGYELFRKKPVLAWEWEIAKDDMHKSKRGIEKKNWLEYMQKNYRNIDNKKATSLYSMVFNGNKKIIAKLAKQKLEDKIAKNDPNITQEDIKDVTDMSSLFRGVNELKVDISTWDVLHVIDMRSMFEFSTFNPDISKWKVDNVTDMRFMFYDATFDRDISGWNVSNVTNMDNMFKGVKSFNQDISMWKFNSKVDKSKIGIDIDRMRKLKKLGKFRVFLEV